MPCNFLIWKIKTDSLKQIKLDIVGCFNIVNHFPLNLFIISLESHVCTQEWFNWLKRNWKCTHKILLQFSSFKWKKKRRTSPWCNSCDKTDGNNWMNSNSFIFMWFHVWYYTWSYCFIEDVVNFVFIMLFE